MWAFGVSPYGLGLSDRALWGLTPREYAALKDQWESSREFHQSLYAGLQATLHNTAGKSFKGRFSPAMWMPGYVPPTPMAIERARMEMQQAHTAPIQSPEEIAACAERLRVSQDRARRAGEARARGASRQEILDIMEGRGHGG